MVSGRIQEFQFNATTSAAEICQHVFENWPKGILIYLNIFLEWSEEKVASSSLLKLIYHGRFLHGSVTLNALSLPAGKTTVMHLVTRENLPEPNSNGLLILNNKKLKKFLDNLKKSKRSSCCRCSII